LEAEMNRFNDGIIKIDKVMYVIAGSTLVAMVLVTLCDVVLRNFGHPITGSMEIIQYGGSIVFGFSLPYATYLRAMVQVDILTEKLKPGPKRLLSIVTRIIALLFLLFVAYNFFGYGQDARKAGEVTASFRVPTYPFIYALSLCFVFHSLTVVVDLIRTIRKEKDE
jgi:TRAP-type C4-dicarboxylate transport system permease small subunit